MSEHFIRNIEIKNFKLFKDFKADGFGRVNLIGGKNNVGKTAFMETLLFNSSVENSLLNDFIKALISIEVFRNYVFLYDLENANNNAYMKMIVSFLKTYQNYSNISNRNKIFVRFNKDIEVILNDHSYVSDDFSPVFMDTEISIANNFISSIFVSSHQLVDLYDGIKLARKRENINTFIRMFDNDLSEYDIIDDTPVCFSENLDSFVNLDAYGNGLKRYVAYVSAIWANQNGYIYIDELENGIHYTNLDKMWEVILRTSKEANVQVFATTHSKECIESFARVAKKLEDEEIRFIELGRNKNDQIKAIVMDTERFYRDLKAGNEVRGW